MKNESEQQCLLFIPQPSPYPHFSRPLLPGRVLPHCQLHLVNYAYIWCFCFCIVLQVTIGAFHQHLYLVPSFQLPRNAWLDQVMGCALESLLPHSVSYIYADTDEPQCPQGSGRGNERVQVGLQHAGSPKMTSPTVSCPEMTRLRSMKFRLLISCSSPILGVRGIFIQKRKELSPTKLAGSTL